MNIEQARHNMLTQQCRATGVLDDDILTLLEQTPRESFVPQAYHNLAFADMPIPLAHDQVMLTPIEEAHMIQSLQIQPEDTVLEIGTGTGFCTALLAKQAHHVVTVDIFPDFIEEAHRRLQQLRLNNITYEVGDGSEGWAQNGLYDAIAVTGGLPYLPESFKKQLRIGGRIFAILGQAPNMTVNLLTKVGDGQWQSKQLFETVTKPLIHHLPRETFTF